jgi:hypothetical protein
MSERTPETEAELAELLRAVETRAPEELHLKVQAMVDRQAVSGRSRMRLGTGGPRIAVRAGAAVALVAAAIALAVALSSGGSSSLSSSQAAALTLSAATMGPPPESPARHGELAAGVDGVGFPYWEGRLGWRATGSRAGRLDGRAVRTVFYADAQGQQVGYAIVSGTPAPHVVGGTVVWRDGTAYRLTGQDGSPVLTWQRDGRLCILAGRGVGATVLLSLASSQQA